MNRLLDSRVGGHEPRPAFSSRRPRSPAFGNLGDHGPQPAAKWATIAGQSPGFGIAGVPQRVKPLLPSFSPISFPFIHLRRTAGLPVFSRFLLYWIHRYPKSRPRPAGLAGKETPVAPSAACWSQNRMLNRCHRFSGCAAAKPCILRIVRNKFRRICYLPRTSWPKPLKTKNLTKTTPRGRWGVPGLSAVQNARRKHARARPWLGFRPRRMARSRGASPATIVGARSLS